jgi:hypothetical protein
MIGTAIGLAIKVSATGISIAYTKKHTLSALFLSKPRVSWRAFGHQY